ncbi:mycothiol conjugate amidase Mca [Sinomonas halotolerans]|uniref:Mycothiol S-conjugate amidase n=1 Tax=Sinomonas halotolerans TaxID=1644133 RepID=A0ABU9WVQ8_9MICC
MSENERPLRLLAVHAHPDDESSKGAPMMAKYLAEGHEVMVVSCTDGSRGDIQNPRILDAPHPLRDMAGARRLEMAAAQRVIGVQHRWLGFTDSGLPEGDPLPPLPWGSFATLPLEQAAAPLVRLMREFRPHVVVSYDENGGYPHPDHIMAHRIAVEAFHAAGKADAYPDAGEPWEPAKLYYDVPFNPDRVRRIHDALVAAGLESPYADWIAKAAENDAEGHRPWKSRHRVTTQVECSAYFAVRDRALAAHATQIDPDGWFFAVSLELREREWPWEDYSLMSSSVGGPAEGETETDLFAGLR